jgi:hypothetical protein
VEELLDGMSAVEFQRWREFNETDPITQDRADLRAALVCSTIAQAHGAKLKPSDFLPRYGPPPEREPMTDEQLKNQAMKITAMLGGKVKHRKT